MEGIQTFKGSWPWPWIRPYGIPSCITHRPLPIYQISFKSKKLFVDGRTDVRMDIFPPSNIIRSTFGSRPKYQKHYSILLPVAKRTVEENLLHLLSCLLCGAHTGCENEEFPDDEELIMCTQYSLAGDKLGMCTRVWDEGTSTVLHSACQQHQFTCTQHNITNRTLNSCP